MAKKAAGAAKKRSGSLSVHLVLLLVLAVLGWRLYVQQGENEKARAEHDAYAQQVETLKQDNEALRADIARGRHRRENGGAGPERVGLDGQQRIRLLR